MKGTVYTETTVYSPPEPLAAEAPYQLVIVDLEAGTRVTARVVGPPVVIGDPVVLAESRDGVPFFRKA